MPLVAFFERRKEVFPVDAENRKNGDRRSTIDHFSSERRRLSSQIRHSEREKFRIPLRLSLCGKSSTGYTNNISSGGFLMISDAAIQAGTPMSLQFSFGENVCYLNISGQVIFCLLSKNGASGQYEVGIKFSAIRDWEKIILESAVHELERSVAVREESLLTIIISEDSLALEASAQTIGVPKSLEDRRYTIRKSSVHASKIIGWGSYHPSQEFNSQDITDMVNGVDYKNVGQVIEALTGIKSRRYEKPELFPSDLAAIAARNALDKAGVDAKDLDVIIFFGISRDFDEPATANVVQEKIGATNSYVFDLANACNGFVTAVDILDSLIASGRCETGLVVTGELISPYIDWSPSTKEDLKRSIFGYTIGDAGGAAVLTHVHHGEDRGIRARWFLNDGSHWRIALAGKMQGANPNDKYFKCNGIDIERASIKATPPGMQEILRLLQWSLDDVDLVIPHQVPISIQKNLYHEALGIPNEKLFWTFNEYGNNATASMPVAVCEALKKGRLKDGDKVLLVGAAAGFSSGIIGMVF